MSETLPGGDGVVNDKLSGRLVWEMIKSGGDIEHVLEKHGMSPEALAGWIADPVNQRVLAALCLYSDMQCQLVLSRCRRIATSQLLRMAENGDKSVTQETARRACTDLMKIELKRVGVADATLKDLKGGDGFGLEAAAGFHEEFIQMHGEVVEAGIGEDSDGRAVKKPETAGKAEPPIDRSAPGPNNRYNLPKAKR